MALVLGQSIAAIASKIAGQPRATTEAADANAVSALHVSLGRKGAAAPAPDAVHLVGRRVGLWVCFSGLALSVACPALSAVLEADDDLELLEKVKNDRKKRLQKQGVISSSAKETGYLQELVYKLSKVGKAIESNDFSEAILVLRPSARDDWIKNASTAFAKLTSSPEEKSEVESFNTYFASLISSVDKHEIESSKSAFVSSATALEKWTQLTGLASLLKGL